jgi:SAM-dependent methyltransferase
VDGPVAHNAQWGPLGQALLDYHRGFTEARITVHTDLWHDESTPVEEFYRPEDQPLPEVDTVALDNCRGRTLDFGAGAGRHALELQKRGHEVTAVDIAHDAVAVCRDRGVKDVRCGHLASVTGERFETIVLLMHGIGLVGTLDRLAGFLQSLRGHLDDDGEVIFDSADLGLVIPEYFDDGLERWRSGRPYPGEIEYRLTYGELLGDPYPWLFVDPITLADHSRKAGFSTEVIARGERGAFLARLRRLK